MRKIVLSIIAGFLIASCGQDKKKESEVKESKKVDNYSIVIDAIYEEDDSLAVFHQVNNYYLYDKPTTLKVKGSPQMQRITFLIPTGVAAENFTFVTSTNKNQKYLTLKNVTIMNNDSLVVDGTNFKFIDYFMYDQSFTWDAKLLRNTLNHNNQYPPAIVGSNKLLAVLKK